MTDPLTTAEAAALLGLSSEHISLRCRQGKLKAVKRGRDWFIAREALDEWRASEGAAGWPKGRSRAAHDASTPPQQGRLSAPRGEEE